MAATVVNAPPFIVQTPLIKVGAAGSEVTFQCAATNLTVEVDQDENTTETFCGSYTSYKAEVWTITASVAMSYTAANGLWGALRPLVGTVQPFQIQPDEAAASTDNPNMSGTAMVKAFSFIDAAPGEASEIDVVLGVQGAPTFGTTAPALAETEGVEPEDEVA